MSGQNMRCTINLRADVVVIGAGAAGLMCSLIAAQNGLDVIMLEPNKLTGKKVRITGKGRCNVTNNCEPKDIIANIPQNGKFMQSSVNKFTPADTMNFFESLGVKLKTERGRRVFPVSDNAHEVVNALENAGKAAGVKILHMSATKILTTEGKVSAVMANGKKIDCNSVVICTGGKSYPMTGSTGDGYKMARDLGHSIVDYRGSLVPLESDDDYCIEMQGFSLKNVELSVFEDDKRIYKELGEMMFTHFGVTGPLILSASSHMRHFGKKSYRLEIDLKPALDEKKLDTRILRDFEKFNNREFKNSLSELAGRTMIPVLVELSGIDPETKVNSITREQRLKLVSLFKAFPVSITRPRPVAEAIVTSGGVSTKEINPRTMESKLVEGLYFAGEVIDVDAYTGGYNLQIAWSSAYTAAMALNK